MSADERMDARDDMGDWRTPRPMSAAEQRLMRYLASEPDRSAAAEIRRLNEQIDRFYREGHDDQARALEVVANARARILLTQRERTG